MLLADAKSAATWRRSLPRNATVGLVPKHGATDAIAACKKSCDYTVIAAAAESCDAKREDSAEKVVLLRKKASGDLKQVWIEGDDEYSARATEAMYLLSWIRPDTVFVDDECAAAVYGKISQDFLFAATITRVDAR